MSDQETPQQQEEQRNSRLLIILKAIGIFLKGASNFLIKIAVSAITISMYMQNPEKIKAWVPVSIIVGTFALDLFRYVHIKTPWFELDLRGDKSQSKEEVSDGNENPKG